MHQTLEWLLKYSVEGAVKFQSMPMTRVPKFDKGKQKTKAIYRVSRPGRLSPIDGIPIKDVRNWELFLCSNPGGALESVANLAMINLG